MVLAVPTQSLRIISGITPAGNPEESTMVDDDVQSKYAHKVVLFNDELHSYPYVVEMLTACCGISKDAAFRCAVEVDLTGRTIVYHGTYDACSVVCNKITSYGADHRMPNSFGSMNAEVQ